ncbi:family 43 glycosylhydrolase [Archangium violaceum]|uniref:family 43 glycosylhydrolase n=1 Tax=Archangium violaceum TaxID=83451 RepID=UPI00193C19CB|nr:family 43 glycosylhydrolase [Archangium violaceum]QRK04704.1 family 43 glycosylhydrolase [Archangium violaceum]
MHSRGVLLPAAVLSLSVLAALSTPSCVPQSAPPQPPPPAQPPPPLEVTNPVLSGDFADPSVLRVGEDYWAAATSSEWAPHFPLLHSKDLLHWEVVGPIFQTAPTWSEGNYWAPELAQDKGRYFVFYTARQKGGPLCVAVATAEKPSGPYTDHGPLVCQELGSIDGALIRDENDALYLVWKEDGNSRSLPTPIWAQPLSEDGTRLIGERTQILMNDSPWEGQLVEGPHLIKRNGWFYMFYAGSACCGRDCNYAVGVARSRKLLGGWEKNPLNPIMKSNEAWKCPGHGSVVTDTQGRDYFLYHAYRATDFVYVGRQGLLDEIQWAEDGWPTINGRRGPGGKVLAKPAAFSEEFTSPPLASGWVWPNGRQPTTSVEAGLLILAPPADRAEDPLGAVFARATNAGNYTAETVLDVSGLTAGMAAGLSAFGDPENALGMYVRPGKVEVWHRERNTHEVIATLDVPTTVDGKLRLRMTAKNGQAYRFAVSAEGTTWTEVGPELAGAYLPPWDRGVRVALTAGGVAGASARFDSLRITPN